MSDTLNALIDALAARIADLESDFAAEFANDIHNATDGRLDVVALTFRLDPDADHGWSADPVAVTAHVDGDADPVVLDGSHPLGDTALSVVSAQRLDAPAFVEWVDRVAARDGGDAGWREHVVAVPAGSDDPAFPEGRCDACGNGLDADSGECVDVDCSACPWDVACAECALPMAVDADGVSSHAVGGAFGDAFDADADHVPYAVDADDAEKCAGCNEWLDESADGASGGLCAACAHDQAVREERRGSALPYAAYDPNEPGVPVAVFADRGDAEGYCAEHGLDPRDADDADAALPGVEVRLDEGADEPWDGEVVARFALRDAAEEWVDASKHLSSWAGVAEPTAPEPAGHGAPALDGARRRRAAQALDAMFGCGPRAAHNAIDHGRYDLLGDSHAARSARTVVEAYASRRADARAVEVLLGTALGVDCTSGGGEVRVAGTGGVEYVGDDHDWSRVDRVDAFRRVDTVATGLPARCANPMRVARAIAALAGHADD